MNADEKQIMKELTESLEDMVRQHCYCEQKTGYYDSGALTADADAMRLLAKLGKFEIDLDRGRIVRGSFK
jgi:hypothetical protein